MYWLCWVFIAVQALLQLLGGGFDPVGVLGLLVAVAALVAGHGLWVPALKRLWLPSRSSRVKAPYLWYRGLAALRMWDLPRSGVESTSPESAGVFFSIEPPEKPSCNVFKKRNRLSW